MSKESSQSVKIPEFGARMREAFGGVSNAEIARKMGKSEPAVKNYIEGRVTLPVVMDISHLTGCSVDWLLAGTGEKESSRPIPANLDETFREMIRGIVKDELDFRGYILKEIKREKKNEKERIVSPSPKEK